jgi:hypothetical protein
MLILLACLISSLRPVVLLQLALVASVFEAAAAVTFGGLGLQPAMLPAAFFSAYMGLQILLGARYAGSALIWRSFMPMALFAGWALLSSVLLPRLLQGQVWVSPQKLEPPFAEVLLDPSTLSKNPDIYLVVDCLILLFVALFASGPSSRASRVMNAYVVSGYVAVGIGLWQFANKVAGVPFPEDFLYSNPGWTIHSGQTIGGIPRINGSFSEPAAFAGFLVNIVCSTGWMAINGNGGRSVRILLAAALVMVLLSTSTTGYGVLAMAAAGLTLYALVRGTRRLRGRILSMGVVLVLSLAVVGLTTTAFLPAVNEAAAEILASTMGKKESQSYEERSNADAQSLQIAADTGGIGVGWGGNRSSSLIPGILSNVGVPGFAALLWFAFAMVRLVGRSLAVIRDPRDLAVIQGAIGSVLGSLGAALLSGPSITSVTFFAMLGLIIGASARALAAVGTGRPARVPSQPARVAFASPP